MVSYWRGEIRRSNAVGFPCFQQGRKILAGWELDNDSRDGTSFLGAKAADWAAEKMTSLRELCQWMRSPLPLQPTWWSPKPSVTTCQTGQVDPSWHIWTPSCRNNQKSWCWICRPRALEGTTFSQLPYIGLLFTLSNLQHFPWWIITTILSVTVYDPDIKQCLSLRQPHTSNLSNM